ncbi:Mu-like prophage major head subunit gpT [Chitinophaga skermanii]|uniref:Mu-like prophage major head subunit gpT n=1 Tax=Chitinophaga skermanii TaxID=331697 RepID=A0A327QB84_9BACT|nr:prohead protease/major capsid protein fusion protein [Chitinophaga skermanii]RAJ00463.1 Mu-like prophage major head subunit gpT [Chitinophaga skermanii]
MPQLYYQRAFVDSNTIKITEDGNFFDVVFATETPVYRNGWDESFYEILSCNSVHIRAGRLENGVVPLLDNHARTKQLGIVTKYSIENNECRATIKFSTQEQFTGIWNDILAGIIRSISVGYNVHKYLREINGEGSAPNYRAIDWEPIEISLTPIPADYHASIREETTTQKPEIVMPSNNEHTERTQATEILTAERNRCTLIRNAARIAKMDVDFTDDLIERGLTIEQAREEIFNKMAEQSQAPTVNTAHVTADESEKTREAMTVALLHRAAPGSVPLIDQAHDYKYLTLLDFARRCIDQRGDKSNRYSPNEVVKRAFSSTDFPVLLHNAVERSIKKYYDGIDSDWKKIAKKTTAKDFKEKTGTEISGSTTFEEIKEGGEYKNAFIISSNQNKVQLKTFGRVIKVTRKTVINDDLEVFNELPRILAYAAENFQAQKVWSLVTQNAKSSDNVPLFHANHKNLFNHPLNEEGLNALRTSMKRQTQVTQEPIIAPKFLIVPIELQMKAEKMLTSEIASEKNDKNTMRNSFTPINTPWLTDPNVWYLCADPNLSNGLVYAYLEGEEGLHVEKEVDFNDDSLSTKARIDFDCTIWDHRSWTKSSIQ